MNLESSFEGGRARKQAQAPPPFGPGFAAEIVAKTEKLEVHCSEFKDPGPDFTEFRAFDAEGALIARQRIGGY